MKLAQAILSVQRQNKWGKVGHLKKLPPPQKRQKLVIIKSYQTSTTRRMSPDCMH